MAADYLANMGVREGCKAVFTHHMELPSPLRFILFQDVLQLGQFRVKA